MTCKRDHWYLTAGGRELRLKARPPARLTCNPSLQKHTQSKDKETKTTAPSGNTPFGTTNHLQSPFRVTVTFGARGSVETFLGRLNGTVQKMTPVEKQKVLRIMVKQITVGKDL